jgi:hypothetical protein
MISTEQAIVSVAQTMLRHQFPKGPVSRNEIEAAVDQCGALFPEGLAEDARERIIIELETRIVIKIGKPTKLVDERGHVPWYFGDRKLERRYFQRYSDLLRLEEGWPQASIESLDESTDQILEELEDPDREEDWNRRGLVVGHVQSGKTANYAGLIAKAADAGYKLIIVLAGMHNVLRQQTQRRLDRDFLGYISTSNLNGQGFTRFGVGLIDASIHPEHLTTQAANGDFRRAFADNLGMGVQQRPVLLVVKKNASILRNLNNWVQEVLLPRGDTESRPLLVIDDEADQASVDTGLQEFDADEQPDLDYEPKRINGQIRQLLSAFSRSAYVGYTATPFANILIHDAATAEDYGDDLFPRSFIINLPSPSNYVGPHLIFGTGLDEEPVDEPLPLIRHVDQKGEGWIAEEHKMNFVPRFQGEERIPPSLEDAILSFILACAARLARGQQHKHNSMLVHVSRFKDVHQRVFAQIDDWLGNVKRALTYQIAADDLLRRLETLWCNDFVPTWRKARYKDIGNDLPPTDWLTLKSHLALAADKIRVQVVNSEMRDAIDYNANRDNGLSIIAIGGDKLSRGLTLEGLTVSYFLRASRMYDSLMQMGRWFGYRPGYVDLCRLYLTPDLELWFRHISDASAELRNRLDHMAMIGATPEQYGLRIQSHEILLVTAPNKMRHAREFQVSFEGEGKIQTVFFTDESLNQRNADTIFNFLMQLETPVESDAKRSQSARIWKRVPGLEVANLLGQMLFPEEAREINADRLAAYIRTQLAAGELTEWSVALLAGRGEEITMGPLTFPTIERKPLNRGSEAGRYIVKTILSPRDEALDLSDAEYERALELSNTKRQQTGKPATDVPSGPEIRKVRGADPRRGLLLIYPLSPKAANLDSRIPIFGVVISFPDSGSGRSVRYRFNTVAERFELV